MVIGQNQSGLDYCWCLITETPELGLLRTEVPVEEEKEELLKLLLDLEREPGCAIDEGLGERRLG